MNDLTQRLAREAEGFDRRGGSPLQIDQVLERAGEIRRGRRLRATLVMAAAVLAIAVPAGLIALDRDAREPAPAPPSRVDTSPLGLEGLDRGVPPRDGYATAKTYRLDQTAIRLPVGRGTVADVARVNGGLLVAVRAEDGALSAQLVDEQGGTSGPTWPMEGGFAVSDSGDLGAFVQPDGTPVVLSSTATGDPDRVYALPRIPRGSGFGAVAVDGQGCRTDTEFPCRVWVSSRGTTPQTWTSTFGSTAERAATGYMTVSDVEATETFLAGMTSASDNGSCSAVGPVDARPTWTTCDHQLGSFSPDGEHLTGLPAYSDGAGSSELAFLDAATGHVALELHSAQDAFIGQVVWEDDTHVLATVSDGGRWAIVRIGLDGSREYAVAPVSGPDPYESPFVLPSR